MNYLVLEFSVRYFFTLETRASCNFLVIRMTLFLSCCFPVLSWCRGLSQHLQSSRLTTECLVCLWLLHFRSGFLLRCLRRQQSMALALKPDSHGVSGSWLLLLDQLCGVESMDQRCLPVFPSLPLFVTLPIKYVINSPKELTHYLENFE